MPKMVVENKASPKYTGVSWGLLVQAWQEYKRSVPRPISIGRVAKNEHHQYLLRNALVKVGGEQFKTIDPQLLANQGVVRRKMGFGDMNLGSGEGGKRKGWKIRKKYMEVFEEGMVQGGASRILIDFVMKFAEEQLTSNQEDVEDEEV